MDEDNSLAQALPCPPSSYRSPKIRPTVRSLATPPVDHVSSGPTGRNRRQCLRTESDRNSTSHALQKKKVRFHDADPTGLKSRSGSSPGHSSGKRGPKEYKSNRIAERKQRMIKSMFTACRSCQVVGPIHLREGCSEGEVDWFFRAGQE